MAAEHVWDESKRCCRETLIANLDKTNFESGDVYKRQVQKCATEKVEHTDKFLYLGVMTKQLPITREKLQFP